MFVLCVAMWGVGSGGLRVALFLRWYVWAARAFSCGATACGGPRVVCVVITLLRRRRRYLTPRCYARLASTPAPWPFAQINLDHDDARARVLLLLTPRKGLGLRVEKKASAGIVCAAPPANAAPSRPCADALAEAHGVPDHGPHGPRRRCERWQRAASNASAAQQWWRARSQQQQRAAWQVRGAC